MSNSCKTSMKFVRIWFVNVPPDDASQGQSIYKSDTNRIGVTYNCFVSILHEQIQGCPILVREK